MDTNNTLTSELTIRSITSINFIIKTKAIHELEAKALSWLPLSTCGGIIYGRARIGKTRAMISLIKSIKAKYGEDFPVISWDITDHAVTEKNFYTSLLMAMGYDKIPSHHTALALKERVLNTLSIAAYQTPFKKVVIMLDEAWKFSEKDFSWLMDLYNNLNKKDILMTCFLFGTHELKDVKTSLKAQGKDQIIGRFMINEFKFFGIKEMEEMMLCLLHLDKMTVTTAEGNSSVLISDYYFPYRDGHTFFDICKPFWEAFVTVQSEADIKAQDIPMKYFIDSFILMLQNYGKFSDTAVAFPGLEELVECVKLSGYGESDDEYELSKHRVKKSKTRKR